MQYTVTVIKFVAHSTDSYRLSHNQVLGVIMYGAQCTNWYVDIIAESDIDGVFVECCVAQSLIFSDDEMNVCLFPSFFSCINILSPVAGHLGCCIC